MRGATAASDCTSAFVIAVSSHRDQPSDARTTLATVSHVRVVTSLPKVRSMSDMNTGPLGVGR